MDNVFIERLWRSVKYEEIYIKECDSVTELVQSLSNISTSIISSACTKLWRKDTRRVIFGTAAALKAA